MPAAPEASASPPVDLDAAADQAIEACGGDAREVVKVLLVANDFLEKEIEQLRASATDTIYKRIADDAKTSSDGRNMWEGAFVDGEKPSRHPSVQLDLELVSEASSADVARTQSGSILTPVHTGSRDITVRRILQKAPLGAKWPPKRIAILVARSGCRCSPLFPICSKVGRRNPDCNNYNTIYIIILRR
jgi:hypothetical protein